MGKQKLRTRTRMRAIHKMAIAASALSMAGLAAYFTFFAGSTSSTESNAATKSNMMLGYEAGNGEVIVQYTWDEGVIEKAEKGPNAVFMSKFATCTNSGTENTFGIGPGTTGAPLNFTIPASRELNLGGIDLSIDYRRSETTCDLFSRGNNFSLGLKNGKLAIAFVAKTKDKKTIKINQLTRYEVPADDEYRKYRFMFDPVSGKANIDVNGITVWTELMEPQTELTWKESEPMIVGKNLKGDGTEKAFIDNVVVKSTRQISKMPVTLINFEAAAEDNHIMVSWYTASESEIDSFIVERSTDAKTFTEVGRVQAKGAPETLTAYAMVDKNPVLGVAYYRLRPTNKPLTSITISTIGYKYRGAGNDLKVSDLNSGEQSKK